MFRPLRKLNRWMDSTHYSKEKIVAVLFGVPLAILFVVSTVISYATIEQVQVRIEDTGSMVVMRNDKVDAEWVVYTEHEVFRNTNTLRHFKLNSHRIQSQFKPGMVCDLTVNGLGIRRRNILKVTRCIGG